MELTLVNPSNSASRGKPRVRVKCGRMASGFCVCVCVCVCVSVWVVEVNLLTGCRHNLLGEAAQSREWFVRRYCLYFTTSHSRLLLFNSVSIISHCSAVCFHMFVSGHEVVGSTKFFVIYVALSVTSNLFCEIRSSISRSASIVYY